MEIKPDADPPTQHVAGEQRLPGFEHTPDVPRFGLQTSAMVIREDGIRARVHAVNETRRLRADARRLHRTTLPPYEHREIVIRLVLGRSGVGAVVDWRDGGMGSTGVLHRLSGPLFSSSASMRSAGPLVALRIALRALDRLAENAES